MLAEANYLGFVTIRRAVDGEIITRYMAQTALVETIRFDLNNTDLLLVGAGFEGRRDYGIAKILSLMDGKRIGELRGHDDDITDVMPLPGPHRRIVTVGLDRRVIVHDLYDPTCNWIWDGYEDYLNTCSVRPLHDGQFAVAGDSPYTYVLDANSRQIVVRIETPGDCNGLAWSEEGRYLLVGDDHAEVKYFDSMRRWELVRVIKVGGAAKRMVPDPARAKRVLVACYDGRVWSVPCSPSDGGEPQVVVDRRPGLWGINVAATTTRLAVPSFFDRAYLIRRYSDGSGGDAIGPEPKPTFGCNWIAVDPKSDRIAITHDDARIRVRDANTGSLQLTLGPDSNSLYMGASFHPVYPFLATIDFYGDVLIYDILLKRVVWRKDMNFGPGITVEYSRCGQFLAVGGYRWDGRVFDLDSNGLPINEVVLEAPNKGVIKNMAFTSDGKLLVASGDGALVVHVRNARTWRAVHCLRTSPPMELSNGVTSSPDGKIAYIVSRDQTIRAFNIETGKLLNTGYGHTRSVKTVHMSECGRYLATGSYDRTVMLWNPAQLTVRLPPMRGANSGISCVRIYKGVVYSCSFDGVVSAWDAETGELHWTRTSLDISRGN
ncbi:MAG: WD40 repeat domain-containing protein [Thermogemmata sp.]|nr:WD40 repeat domain-containing protein [Thermogemmata sp.]